MEELVSLVMKKTGVTIDSFLSGKGQVAAATDVLGGFLKTAKKPAKKK